MDKSTKELRAGPSANEAFAVVSLARATAHMYLNASTEVDRTIAIGKGGGEYIHARHRFPKETSTKVAIILHHKLGGRKAIQEMAAAGELEESEDWLYAMLAFFAAIDEMAEKEPQMLEEVLHMVMKINEKTEEDEDE